MTWAELLPHLVTLALGLVGGGGIAAVIKARREIYVLGNDSALRSLQVALNEADQDKAELRGALAEVRAELATERDRVAQLGQELATERACRVELEHRLARLERAAD